MIRRVPTFPVADLRAARTLGAALRSAGYDEEAVADLLGDDGYRGGPAAVPVHDRRLPHSPIGTVIRLFFLQLPVPRRAAERALGRAAVRALEATGIADADGDDVVPNGRIVPVGSLVVASDGFSRDADDPPDYVATYSPTSRVCDFLTPRRKGERALDVGTGPGIHALLAARHARTALATDVNARALAFTQVNAALNDLPNVEVRSGSLFEPAGDDAFDLITCNAPFVVSPERRWAYRDAGFLGDELSERVVRGAAERLAQGGFATLLVSWIAHDADDPDARVVEWVADSGCDAWILPSFGGSPLDHAASWNSHFDGDTRAYATVLDEWTTYFAELGVEWITEGAILLHRRSGGGHTVRIDEIDEEELEPADAQIRRAFAARARLAEVRRRADLLGERLAAAPALRVEHEVAARGGAPVVTRATVVLDEGTLPTLDADVHAADVVASLDGRATLDRVVHGVAREHGLPKREVDLLERRSLALAQELLELGALSFR